MLKFVPLFTLFNLLTFKRLRQAHSFEFRTRLVCLFQGSLDWSGMLSQKQAEKKASLEIQLVLQET